MKILIVDDGDRIREELDEFLSAAGHTVFHAGLPSEAFRITEQHSPDIAILDIRLPEAEGLTVPERMKALCPDMEIFMIADNGDMDTVIRAMRSGVSDFFSKPFQLSEILGPLKEQKNFLT
ncbi:MAG: response regulator [Desulfococcaceae bacterium]